MSEFLYTCESCGEQMDEGESSPCTCCRLAASQAREARLREALETAIERLNADAQWAGQNEDAQLVCLDCGAVAPDAVQLARMARPPSGEHADGCEFVAMMAELRAALAADGEGGSDE